MRTGRRQSPTCVSLVENVLRARAEFTDVAMLCRFTGCTRSQVQAALHHLRHHRAADVVVEKDGTGWWFATPETDTRQHIMEQRAEEVRKRKPRRINPARNTMRRVPQ